MWDPTEHLVILEENRKYENINYTLIFARNRPQSAIIHDFREIFEFLVWELHMRSEAIFQYLRFVCNRAHVRSHRAPCDLGRKSKIRKRQLCVHMCQKSRFLRDFDFQYESFIWDLKKFFKSLRFFCNRAHGRSRRAACDCGRKSKIENTKRKSKNLSINALKESFSGFLWRDLQ